MDKAKNTPLDWPEDKLQAVFYMWFHNTYPELRGLLFAVPNGGGRSGLEGRLLKSTGTYAGVSDMIFLWKGIAYFLELKKPSGGIQSDKQKAWQKTVEAQSFVYKLFNDLLELQIFVTRIIEGDTKLQSKQLDMFDNIV